MNSFQVVIATDGEQLYVIFNYKNIQPGRIFRTVGFNAGDGNRFFNLLTPSGKFLLYFLNEHYDLVQNGGDYSIQHLNPDLKHNIFPVQLV